MLMSCVLFLSMLSCTQIIDSIYNQKEFLIRIIVVVLEQWQFQYKVRLDDSQSGVTSFSGLFKLVTT